MATKLQAPVSAPDVTVESAPAMGWEDKGVAGRAAPYLFEQMFCQHRGALLAFLRRRIGSDEEAKEAVQDCYLRLLQYDFNQPRPQYQWRALLFRIAANHAFNLARDARARHVGGHRSLDHVELVSDEPSPERRVAAQQDLAVLTDVVHRLSPRCRQVFLLSRVHGKSHAEIAKHCGISVKAVEKHICTALTVCRTRLGFVRHSGSA